MRALDEARKSLKISTADLNELRESKFLMLYNHVIKKSPYYIKF